MADCKVCGTSLSSLGEICPRCGFRQPEFFGDPERAQKVIEQKVQAYRLQYLKKINFGIRVFYWKDEQGTIVPDRQERLAFGTGHDLLGKTAWLEEKFARIPEQQEMSLELSVLEDGEAERVLRIPVTVPQGRYLQQVGMELHEDMTVTMLLKNPEHATQSEPVRFFGE